MPTRVNCLLTNDLIHYFNVTETGIEPKANGTSNRPLALSVNDDYLFSRARKPPGVAHVNLVVEEFTFQVWQDTSIMFTACTGPYGIRLLNGTVLPQQKGEDERYDVSEILDYLIGKDDYLIESISVRYTDQRTFSIKNCVAGTLKLVKSYEEDDRTSKFDLSNPSLYCKPLEIILYNQRPVNLMGVSWPTVYAFTIYMTFDRWDRNETFAGTIPESWFPSLKLIQCPVDFLYLHRRVSRYVFTASTESAWTEFLMRKTGIRNITDLERYVAIARIICDQAIPDIIKIRIHGSWSFTMTPDYLNALQALPKLVIVDVTWCLPHSGQKTWDEVNYSNFIASALPRHVWPIWAITSPSIANVACSLLGCVPHTFNASNKSESMYTFIMTLNS